ncbi:antitoxin Xre/MbcA/ParS toxin-binding domain-containing protein [Pseudomonas sp. NPDC047963]
MHQSESEALERAAAVTDLAVEVFHSRERTACWMSKRNVALGGASPAMLCDTEFGATQVRRLLKALEWGGPV